MERWLRLAGRLRPGLVFGRPVRPEPAAGDPFWRGAWRLQPNQSPPYPKPMGKAWQNRAGGPWSQRRTRDRGGMARAQKWHHDGSQPHAPSSVAVGAQAWQALIAAHVVGTAGVFLALCSTAGADEPEPMWTCLWTSPGSPQLLSSSMDSQAGLERSASARVDLVTRPGGGGGRNFAGNYATH